MDQSNLEVSTDLRLDRLVARASNQLEKLRYSRRSRRRYRTIWRRLMAFSRQMNLGKEYSEDLAARFSDAYRMRAGESLKPGERWRRHVSFAVKVLGDFAREGSFERARIDKRSIQVPAPMKQPLREYEHYCRDRRHLRLATLHMRNARDRGVYGLSAIEEHRDAESNTAGRCHRIRRGPAPSETQDCLADRLRPALLSAVSSVARNSVAGPKQSVADDSRPAGCHHSIGVGHGAGCQAAPSR
jgi:hypothetical protein